MIYCPEGGEGENKGGKRIKAYYIRYTEASIVTHNICNNPIHSSFLDIRMITQKLLVQETEICYTLASGSACSYIIFSRWSCGLLC